MYFLYVYHISSLWLHALLLKLLYDILFKIICDTSHRLYLIMKQMYWTQFMCTTHILILPHVNVIYTKIKICPNVFFQYISLYNHKSKKVLINSKDIICVTEVGHIIALNFSLSYNNFIIPLKSFTVLKALLGDFLFKGGIF